MPKVQKSSPTELGLNRVVLEPNTQITHFEGIQWAIQKVVTGAIAGLLFGDNADQKKSFYKSPTSRRNKEILLQLASQIYSYLDGIISEFANIDDYRFRVTTRVTVDRNDGGIVGDPVFGVDIYKHFGSVSAKGVESKEHIDVAFVGKTGDQFVTPALNKALTRAVREFSSVRLTPYKDQNTAPSSLRSRIVDKSPTLFIGKRAYAVKLKIDPEGANFIFIKDGAKEFAVKDEKDLVVFLSKKSGLRPEILGQGTAFESSGKMEREVRSISDRILKNADNKSREIDLIESMQLDSAIKALKENLSSPTGKSASGEAAIERKTLERELELAKKKYADLKVEYEVAEEELGNLEEKLEKNHVTLEQYRVERWKIQRNKIAAKDQLIDLQANVKGDLAGRVSMLMSRSSKSKAS